MKSSHHGISIRPELKKLKKPPLNEFRTQIFSRLKIENSGPKIFVEFTVTLKTTPVPLFKVSYNLVLLILYPVWNVICICYGDTL